MAETIAKRFPGEERVSSAAVGALYDLSHALSEAPSDEAKSWLAANVDLAMLIGPAGPFWHATPGRIGVLASLIPHGPPSLAERFAGAICKLWNDLDSSDLAKEDMSFASYHAAQAGLAEPVSPAMREAIWDGLIKFAGRDDFRNTRELLLSIAHAVQSEGNGSLPTARTLGDAAVAFSKNIPFENEDVLDGLVALAHLCFCARAREAVQTIAAALVDPQGRGDGQLCAVLDLEIALEVTIEPSRLEELLPIVGALVARSVDGAPERGAEALSVVAGLLVSAVGQRTMRDNLFDLMSEVSKSMNSSTRERFNARSASRLLSAEPVSIGKEEALARFFLVRRLHEQTGSLAAWLAPYAAKLTELLGEEAQQHPDIQRYAAIASHAPQPTSAPPRTPVMVGERQPEREREIPTELVDAVLRLLPAEETRH